VTPDVAAVASEATTMLWIWVGVPFQYLCGWLDVGVLAEVLPEHKAGHRLLLLSGLRRRLRRRPGPALGRCRPARVTDGKREPRPRSG